MMEIENKRIRCHGSIVLEKTGKTLAWLLLLVAVNFGDVLTATDVADDEKWIGGLIIIGVILAIMALVLGFAILKWRKTTITIDEDALIWDKDTLNKKTLTIGIENISSINIERNIFERIIGTAKLKLDTDSLSTADETDVEFVFKYDDAIRYKEYLEAKVRSYDAKPTEKITGEEPKTQSLGARVEYDNEQEKEPVRMNQQAEYVSDFGEIAAHCLYDLNISSLIIGLPLVVFAIIGFVAMFMDGQIGVEEIFASVVQVVTFGYACIYAIVGKFFRYYNLTVARQENRIYMKYGMFKIREYVIPVEKINAIHIKQTLVGRMCKRYNVSMECVGVGDNEKEIAQLTLSLKMDEIKERLSVLLPEYDLMQLDAIKGISKKAIVHKLMRLVWVIFIATCVNVGIFIGMNIIDDFGVLAKDTTFWIVDAVIVGVILLWVLIHGLLQLKVEAIGLGDRNLMTVTGAYGKDITIISYKKIQYVSTKKSPTSKLTGLVRGDANILSGLLGTVKDIPYMNENDVNTLVERVCNR